MRSMPSNSLLKRDWQKDHVYLVQFPRAGCIPTPSPFAFKLETWLRMNNIPYTNVSNEFKKKSSKGQIPFIEINGRQVADSNFIIEHLTSEFHKEDFDGRLPPYDRASQRALATLLENSLFWTLFYQRSRGLDWLAGPDGFGAHMHGVKAFVFKKVMLGQMKKRFASACQVQGVGRHSPEEVLHISKMDLDALSAYLGQKKYFFGDRPTTTDAMAFALLAQFLYAPLAMPELLTYMQEKTPNLVEFTDRVREAYWPDWEEVTKNKSMDSDWQKKKKLDA